VSLGPCGVGRHKVQAQAPLHKAMANERNASGRRSSWRKSNALMRKAEILDAQGGIRRYG